MKQFLLTMAGVFAGLVLFLIGVPFLLIVMAAGAAKPTPTPAHTVLALDLRDPLTDHHLDAVSGLTLTKRALDPALPSTITRVGVRPTPSAVTERPPCSPSIRQAIHRR